MNIVLGFDDSYCPFAAATIASFCSNNKGHHTFYVITDYISEINRDNLRHDVISFGSLIEFLYVDEKYLKLFPLGKNMANSYVSIATYFRLFIVDILPKDVTRVIYLDCDVIVNSSLDYMWNWKFKNHYCILAAEDEPINASSSSIRLGYDTSFSYFNAGVFMVEIDILRSYLNKEKINSYINKNTNIIKFHDQDILNAFLYKYRELLPLSYNVLEVYYKKKCKLPFAYRDINIDEVRKTPAIIHFSGPIKPWHIECKHPFSDRFLKYIKMTSYSDFVPFRKYLSRKERLKYVVKKITKSTIELLGIKCYSYDTIII